MICRFKDNQIELKLREAVAWRCSIEMVFLKISQNSPIPENTYPGVFTIFLNKKRHRCGCFPVNFAKSLRTSILENICELLLLNLGRSVEMW